MHRLLAIILTVFALLPHPALLAAAGAPAAPCGAPEPECQPACPCCPTGECACAVPEDDLPVVPQTPAPVRGAELHPAPALPPAQIDIPGTELRAKVSVSLFPSVADRVRTIPLLKKYIRNRVFRL